MYVHEPKKKCGDAGGPTNSFFSRRGLYYCACNFHQFSSRLSFSFLSSLLVLTSLVIEGDQGFDSGLLGLEYRPRLWRWGKKEGRRDEKVGINCWGSKKKNWNVGFKYHFLFFFLGNVMRRKKLSRCGKRRHIFTGRSSTFWPKLPSICLSLSVHHRLVSEGGAGAPSLLLAIFSIMWYLPQGTGY